jgi:acetolactate synthase-1/2/3 large subunit
MKFPSQQTNFVDLYEFMASLEGNSNSTHTLVTDAGSNYYVGGQVYKFEQGQREITSGTNAAMGLTIPLAIGAAVAMPENQILAVTGDGSLELNIQELKTINYYNFNIKLFVINNGGYASMRNWQDTFFSGRRIGSDDATGTEMLDLAKVADTFEIGYDSIVYTDGLDDKIYKILQKVGPTLIEVVCNPNQRLFQPFIDTSVSS